MNARVNKSWVHFDQMTWPLPQSADCGLAWRLRYDRKNITESDMLSAAEILSAYHALIWKTQKDRNAICKTLQWAMTESTESSPRPNPRASNKLVIK